MTTPTLRDLILKTGSKYYLVVGIAKRARQILDRKESGFLGPHKPVTIAIEEIAKGEVVVRRVPRKHTA
ncbi:MAG: DNA-directed RNA polymerase subunit omega [Firmicutes bacterium]|jgi:DNA-directed RNA polymerase omega subunit|nr:DNA-directed RNA polymerase subunit omega [Candidatus Fermentithermobacillaceae bacterium]